MRKRTKDVLKEHPAVVPSKPTKLRKWVPRNASQTRCWNTITDNTVTIILGPAGAAKSHTAMSWAIDAVSKNQFERIVCTRPIVESEESLGWLPGDIDTKLQPFMRPLFDIAGKYDDAPELLVVPFAYMRGLTFENSICILDEAQNATKRQLKLYLSRMGYGSKMIITGDTAQFDIRDSGLVDVANAISEIEGVGIFQFTNSDICRHPLVGKILDRLP